MASFADANPQLTRSINRLPKDSLESDFNAILKILESKKNLYEAINCNNDMVIIFILIITIIMSNKIIKIITTAATKQ